MGIFEKAFGLHLQGSLAETAALVVDQIFPIRLPQKPTYPAITYQLVAGNRDHTQDGGSGLVEARYQFNCYAATYAAAKELGEALRKDLDGFKGNVGSGANVATIDGMFLELIQDGYDDELDVFWVTVDFTVMHTEDIVR